MQRDIHDHIPFHFQYVSTFSSFSGIFGIKMLERWDIFGIVWKMEKVKIGTKRWNHVNGVDTQAFTSYNYVCCLQYLIQWSYELIIIMVYGIFE